MATIQINGYPYFSWVFEDTKTPIMVCMYPRGAGKSFAAFDWCLSRIMNDPEINASAMIISNDIKKERKRIEDAASRYEELAKADILTFNRVTGTTAFNLSNNKNSFNRKYIHIGSYNQRQTLRGEHLKYVVLDEAREMSRPLFEQVILPIVNNIGNGGQFLVLGTPRGQDNVLYDLYAKGQDDNFPDVKSKKMTIYEIGQYSPRHTEAAIKIYQANMSPQAFRQEYMCDATVDISYGNIYRDMVETLESIGAINNDIKYNPSLPINLAFDLGFNDASACWIWQVTSMNEIHVIEYFEVRQKYFPEIIQLVKARPYFTDKIKYCILPHDSVQHHISGGGNLAAHKVTNFANFDQNTVYGMARAQGWDAYVLPRTNSVAGCITPCREFLRRCKFNQAACELGLKHLKAYSYETKYLKDKEDEKIVTDIPEEHGEHLHGCDAFRYMAMSENIWNKPTNNQARQDKPRFWTVVPDY